MSRSDAPGDRAPECWTYLRGIEALRIEVTKLLNLHLEPGEPVLVNADRIVTAIFDEACQQTQVFLGWLPWAKDEGDTDHLWVDETPEEIATMAN